MNIATRLNTFVAIGCPVDSTCAAEMFRIAHRIQYSFCSSDRGFIQTTPRDGRHCLGLIVPTTKSVADFHRQVVTRAERTPKQQPNIFCWAVVLHCDTFNLLFHQTRKLNQSDFSLFRNPLIFRFHYFIACEIADIVTLSWHLHGVNCCLFAEPRDIATGRIRTTTALYSLFNQ